MYLNWLLMFLRMIFFVDSFDFPGLFGMPRFFVLAAFFNICATSSFASSTDTIASMSLVFVAPAVYAVPGSSSICWFAGSVAMSFGSESSPGMFSILSVSEAANVYASSTVSASSTAALFSVWLFRGQSFLVWSGSPQR